MSRGATANAERLALETPVEHHQPPRVVLFRANAIDSDSRAKKLSLTLSRLGYEVYALSAEPVGAPTARRRLGRVTVIPVPITRAHRDVHVHRLAARRRRQFRFIDWTPQDEYVTQVRELRSEVRLARRLAVANRDGAAGSPRSLVKTGLWASIWAVRRARLALRVARWRSQWALNVGHRLAWRRWDSVRQESTLLATTRGMLPEVEDYAASFSRILDQLSPDVIHAHHPSVLGTALRAARRCRAGGVDTRVIYDSREDFAGLPKQEQGHRRRHTVLVREEARHIRDVDAVITVSEPIADTLQQRYGLPRRPAVVLNTPVDDPAIRPGAVSGPTVRDAAGLPDDVPLMVYSGAVSRARGVDLMIDSLAHLPQLYMAVVAVPHPHPHQDELVARARALGVEDRLRFCPPVDQDHLLHYLSGADIGVLPFRTGSANIDQALPNKLFEYLHAGLTMVASDARLIVSFIRENDLGEVFHDGDPADLAKAVTRALARPAPDAREREALRRRYSWQGQESTIRDVYGELAPAPNPDGIDAEGFGSLTVSPPGVPVEGAEDRSGPVRGPSGSGRGGHHRGVRIRAGRADGGRGGVSVERRGRSAEPPLDIEEPVGSDNPADAVEQVRPFQDSSAQNEDRYS